MRISLMLLMISSSIFAEQFTVKYSDLHFDDKFLCISNKLHVIAEVDDKEIPLQIFKVTNGPKDENFEEIPCGIKNKIKEINEK